MKYGVNDLAEQIVFNVIPITDTACTAMTPVVVRTVKPQEYSYEHGLGCSIYNLYRSVALSNNPAIKVSLSYILMCRFLSFRAFWKR